MYKLSNKKILAWAFALLMLLVFLFSLSFIASSAEHECCGETCEICEVIAIAEKNLSGTDKNTNSATVFYQKLHNDSSVLALDSKCRVVGEQTPITLFDVSIN